MICVTNKKKVESELTGEVLNAQITLYQYKKEYYKYLTTVCNIYGLIYFNVAYDLRTKNRYENDNLIITREKVI